VLWKKYKSPKKYHELKCVGINFACDLLFEFIAEKKRIIKNLNKRRSEKEN